MKILISLAREALYVESDGRIYNLHVIPQLWQPSDDLYLLLSFLQNGDVDDVAYCDPNHFSRRFSIADRELRLNAILENPILRRRVVQSTQGLTFETRCRIKSRTIFSDEMETMIRFLIRDADDFDMCRTLGASWGIDWQIARGQWTFLRAFVDRPRGDLRREDRPLLSVRRERIIAAVYMRTHLLVSDLDGLLRKYIYDH